MAAPHIWLVAEGFKVSVERCTERILDDEDYNGTGVNMVSHGTWQNAPADAYILGLKERPENDLLPLSHNHIMFAHCYKQQAGWKDVLSCFDAGNGTLLDLEFLVDDRGRRVAAFGYHAGYAGSVVGLDVWCHKIVEGMIKKFGRLPRVIAMGALGRCGSGATDFFRPAGILEENITKWDIAETKVGGPFKEILEHDIFVNCIYLSSPIPPFVTKEICGVAGRVWSVLVDVSCDVTNLHNPVPVYYGATTFVDPILRVEYSDAASLDVVAIDHLPSLLPREASEAFCKDLLPSPLELNRANFTVWIRAKQLFKEKIAESKK
ncbi:Saccharopine dehydrogenase [Physocladia obscura]|uniref:Saccharopine dehydrogenase [NAD(+), L-lysine-forming] n=1 Tax=Physocladia obscura TaxID=109957 RepID=A0AAD5T8B3_9FUNG|nr:Saccharopine dehydrogenase [Physocladia obscura]